MSSNSGPHFFGTCGSHKAIAVLGICSSSGGGVSRARRTLEPIEQANDLVALAHGSSWHKAESLCSATFAVARRGVLMDDPGRRERMALQKLVQGQETRPIESIPRLAAQGRGEHARPFGPARGGAGHAVAGDHHRGPLVVGCQDGLHG
jgi:hypothetical protein